MFKLLLSSDHATPATGKTVAITLSKAGGAFANPNVGASNATEVSSGWYKFALDTVDTNTLGDLVLRGAAASCDDAGVVYPVVSGSGYEEGAVWYNSGIGSAGTTNYVNGTALNPCSSLANCRTIADALKLTKFRVAPSDTVTLDQDYNNYHFVGAPFWSLALAGRDVSGCTFDGAGSVTGTGTSGAYFVNCIISTATLGQPSRFVDCGCVNTLTLGAAGFYLFDGCYNGATSDADWTIDYGALGANTVLLRDFSGSVKVKNMLAGDVFSFSGRGKLTIDATCTAGTVSVRGPIELVNNGSGQTINDTSRWNEDQSMALVTLVTTLTTYTGNTPQTGDAFARIGALGAGLTAVPTFGDFSATQKTSLNAATPASVVGAVGSVAAPVTVTGDLTATMKASVTAAVPTAAQNAAGLLDLTDGVETGLTPRQALRLIVAANAGILSGAATTTVTIKGAGVTTTRIVATVDSDGNRSALTLTP